MLLKKKNKKHESTENQVLTFLETRSASKWGMTKTLNKTYSNVHTVVNCLMKKKLIEISKIEPSSKNPKIKVEYYNLTLLGLIWTLGIPERTFGNIDKIASYHKDRLLVFQEWKTFKKAGVEQEILKSIKSNSQRVLNIVSIYNDHAYQQKLADSIILGIKKEYLPIPPGTEYQSDRESQKRWKLNGDPIPRDETIPDYERILFFINTSNQKLKEFCVEELIRTSISYAFHLRIREGWLKFFGVDNPRAVMEELITST